MQGQGEAAGSFSKAAGLRLAAGAQAGKTFHSVWETLDRKNDRL